MSIERPEPEKDQILVIGHHYKPNNDAFADYEIQIRRHNSLSSTSNNEGFTKHTKYEDGGRDLDFWLAYWSKKFVQRYGYEHADIKTVNLEKEDKQREVEER